MESRNIFPQTCFFIVVSLNDVLSIYTGCGKCGFYFFNAILIKSQITMYIWRHCEYAGSLFFMPKGAENMYKNLIETLKKQLDIRPTTERQKEHADALMYGLCAGIKSEKKEK